MFSYVWYLKEFLLHWVFIGYGYYSYKALSLAQWAALLVLVQYYSIAQVFSYLSCLAVYSLLNVQNNSVKNKQTSLKITDFWEST